jgi:L-ascorbate metabolism protein UlaG (beta-lactamase superfamily)
MGIEVTWLGHSTVVLDVDGTRLITDPLLRRHAGLLRRRGGRPPGELWSGVDAVLLSHLHHDHADTRSLRMLGGRQQIITAWRNALWLQRRDLLGVAPDDGGWVDVGATVSVGLTPAVHHSRPMPHRPNQANGHLVRSRSGVIWVAGDTALFPEMRSIPDQAAAKIDLALVPISGWGPRLSAGHLGPAEAAEACALVDARYAMPVHWGTLHVPGGRNRPTGWMDRPGGQFVAELARRAPGCRPLLPAPGLRTSVLRTHPS